MDLSILPIKPLENEDQIDVHPDFFDLNTGSCVCHIGKPKTGKSVIINNLLMNPNINLIEKLDIVHVYSPTAKSDTTWRFACDQIPDTIYSSYSDAHLQSILDSQMSMSKSCRAKIAIIFDDFLSFHGLNKNSLMFKLASNYRHYGIKLLYFATQKFKSVPPLLRACIDYALISKTTNAKEIEDMDFELGSKYDNKFKSLLSQATNIPYSFLYLKLNSQPAEAFQTFTKKIYTAKSHSYVDIDFPELPEKSKKDEDDYY